MQRGYLCLLLHAHLPFVRHPEHPEFLEEKWFFEAVAECYLPLLAAFGRLAEEGVRFRVTVSLSPTLVAMMDDGLLRSRCQRYLERRLAAAAGAPDFVRADCARALADFTARGGDLAGGFAALQASGHLELMTTAATHGFLPLLKGRASSVRAQVRVAADEQRRRFGRQSAGFWLPECGFFPSLQRELQACGYRYFVVDAHGMPEPAKLAPVDCGGVAAFGRDADSSREIWGPGGFPSSAVYRDFHAVDANGFKTSAVTGLPAKDSYDPVAAQAQVRRQARQFVASRVARIHHHEGGLDHPPVITSAYDAELFGHWWHEGPQFIEEVIRECARSAPALELVAHGDFLARHGCGSAAAPAASSWGQHGFNEFWINASNHWIYPALRLAEANFLEALARANASEPGPARALRQAARSLLLAQASDWPFLMTRGTSVAYAEQRLRDQLARVHFLCAAAAAGGGDARKVRALEHLDCIFPEIDCRHFLEATRCEPS